MKRHSLTTTIALGFGLALMLLLVISVMAHRNTRALIDVNRRVAGTQEVIVTLERVLSAIKDIETGQRGYLITGEERYLEPYYAARSTVEGMAQHLRILTADNPDQHQRLATLEPLVTQKLAELQETIDLRARAGFEAAAQMVRTDRGKQLMDNIRAVVQDMVTAEQLLLSQRAQTAEADARTSLSTIVYGDVLAFVLVALAGYSASRGLTKRQQAEQALAALNEKLEQRVEDRTKALQHSEAAERAQREFFQVTLASIGDAVIVTNPHGEVTFLNHVAEAITGWTMADAVGKPLPEVFPIVNEETHQPVENPVAKVLHTGGVSGLANHTVLLRKDGSTCPIDDSAAPIRDEQDRLLGVILVFRDIRARRQAEQALRESRDQLAVVLQGVADGITAQDATGRLLYANDAAARIIGYPSVSTLLQAPLQEVMQQFEVLDEGGHPFPLSQLPGQQALQGEQHPEALLRFRIVATSEERWSQVKATPIVDEQGTVRFAVNIFHDITALKRAEEALRQSEARYRTVSELVSDYAYAVRIAPDGRGVLEWVTEAFSRITGFSMQEFEMQEGLAWLIHPEDMLAVQQRLQALFAGQSGSSEHRIITKSGEVRWLRDYSTPEWDAAQGRIVRIIGAGQDITAHKRAEEASLRLAAIVESSDDAIISKSLDGVVTSWNAAAERMFGYRAEEMIWQPILRLLPEDRQEEERLILECLQRGERVDHFETVRRTKNGRLLDVSVTLSPLRDERGTIIGASKIVRDITEWKQVEEAQAQRLAEVQRANDELQQFAYIVSHDLSEPLRMVASYVQLLARRYQGQLDTAADEYITFALDGAQRMQHMIMDLLAYTRAGSQSPKSTAVDCETLLVRVLTNLQVTLTESGATITHDPLPTVSGDATRLSQVFQNLIGNALKFRGATSPRIHISAQQESKVWRFTVQDNGIGIDPHQVGRIFQVFQRLHTRQEYPGTGIGLAICKKIVESHHGKIWVESEPDHGATFFFTLPLMETGEAAQRHEPGDQA